ncbi:MAG: ATP-binding cassette domain-containing protein [Candidatus Krumholzibacteria bacterium]|nr:ATP-binding cassette domain-containing protein [Candidatus Krumholzibacteria bacterium]
MEPILTAANLTKRYGDLTAVAGIDFDIAPGECFGLLGPNGAGKTSTAKMIYAAVPVTGGCLCVFGRDITRHAREIKKLIGVCPQDVNLDQDFSVLKNLIVYARYFGIGAAEARRKAEELIEFFQLGDKRDRKIESLSGGMKKRLLVVRALVNDPRLLILDEPTAGLDPQARHQIWEKVRQLKKNGTTIVLTTHYMEEAAVLCDRLAIMDRGRIVERGRPADLVARHIGRDVIEIEDPSPAALEEIEAAGARHETFAGRTYVYTEDGRELIARIAREGQAGHVVLRQAGLEDVFLKLTGRQLRE